MLVFPSDVASCIAFLLVMINMKRSAQPATGTPVEIGDEPNTKRVAARRYMPFSLEQHLTTVPWIEVSFEEDRGSLLGRQVAARGARVCALRARRARATTTTGTDTATSTY